MRNSLLILLAGLLLNQSSFGQDPRLGHYFMAPMVTNPAMMGKNVGDWRALATYRSQWQGSGTEPFTSTFVSLEKNLLGVGAKNQLTGGVMFMTDASNGGLLKHNNFGVGAAYHSTLDGAGKHQLSGGLTFNYMSRILDASKFQFGSQIGSGGYQPVINPNDGVVIPKLDNFDVNAGLLYQYRGESSGFYGGVGYFHAARPIEGAYYNSSYSVDPRLSLQAVYQLKTDANGSELSVSSLFEQQGGYNQFTAGLLYKIGFSQTVTTLNSVNVGVWNRFGDAVYPYLGLEGNQWLLGFSYDVITSKMAGTSLHSFELSFGWQFGKNAGVRKGGVVQY